MKLTRKSIGRIAASFVATAMLATMAIVPASAAPANAEGYEISFAKTIDMTEATGATVPDVSYTYTITAGKAVDAGVTEDGSKTPEIKAGEVNDFTSDTVTINFDYDTEATLKAKFNVVENAYNAPGIYRYVVTETHTANADITFDGESTTYYLDVYVTNDTSDETNQNLKVTGCVWTKGSAYTPVIKGNNAVYGNGTTDKVTGDTDPYKTYSLTITKEVEGDMANGNVPYSFEVDFSNLTNGTQLTVNDTTKTQAATSNATSATFTLTPNEADNNSVIITGIPSNAAYQVIEKLAASEGYTVKASINNGKEATLTNSDNAGYKTVQTTMNKDNNTVVITNCKEAVSPTGIMMDIAPYAVLVVIAAAGCFIFLRKRHAKED